MAGRAAVLAMLTIVLGAQPAVADPYTDLTRGGADACFRRVYDAAHLKSNPRQQINAMTVWIGAKTKGAEAGLAVTRRGDPDALFISASCTWEEYKPGQKSWMESFKRRAGAGCITLAVPDVFPEASSAEEGGGVLFDPAPDGKSMMVHLQDEQVMVKRAARWDKISVKLGVDDRIFLLRRTAARDCDFVKDAVTAREPPRQQR
jgi:hypothetical protein